MCSEFRGKKHGAKIKMRARNWCFTLNNYTEASCELINNIDCVYMVYGFEIGENGTPHLQGYIRFSNQRQLSSLKKLIPRAHFEAAKGSGKQNFDYCTKEYKADDPLCRKYFEKGVCPNFDGSRQGLMLNNILYRYFYEDIEL